MRVSTVGIDLAKNVFQLHGVNELGKTVVKKHLRRDQMAEFFVNLPACLIGMEACGGAHYWARKLQSFGHTVKLMAPQFVKPYVKTNKNDAADAEAICEAVARPNMRFVPIKDVEQQSVLALHTVRQGFVKARTAQANQIRGLLSEFGLIVPQGIWHIVRVLPVANWPKSPASAPSLPAHWWRRLGMPKTLTTDVRWRHGWDWFRGSTPVEESKTCWASASGGTHTFAPF